MSEQEVIGISFSTMEGIKPGWAIGFNRDHRFMSIPVPDLVAVLGREGGLVRLVHSFSALACGKDDHATVKQAYEAAAEQVEVASRREEGSL